jgi:multidrug efflux pump subunit AcrB
VEALRERPIALPGGRTARLGEIAEVSDANAEVRTAARLDGRPVVGFEIIRTRGSSEVRVAEGAAARLAALEAAHPGVEIRRVAATVDFVLAGFRGAVEALMIGAGLAVVVVWLFLRDWRATAIASLAMPLSLVPTFLVMKWLGFSLNNVTLLGLTLVVGVLVDDAIVEIENIVRHLHERRDGDAFRRRSTLRPRSAGRGGDHRDHPRRVSCPWRSCRHPGQFFRQFGLTVAPPCSSPWSWRGC